MMIEEIKAAAFKAEIEKAQQKMHGYKKEIERAQQKMHEYKKEIEKAQQKIHEYKKEIEKFASMPLTETQSDQAMRDTKILIPEIPGEWTQRTRSGHTNIWNDPFYKKNHGLPEVRMSPPRKGLYAERIDGAWYWVCGCEMCLQSGKSWSYVVCEEHDRCVTCRCTRDQLTEAPWGAKGGGWRCKPCDDTMKAEARAKALAAAAASGHSEDDCCYVAEVICPYCATRQRMENRQESEQDIECNTCGDLYDLEVEWSPTYSTSKSKPKAKP